MPVNSTSKQHDRAACYEAWYTTPRGRWIAAREFRLLQRLLAPRAGASLLDAGCGTGHFSRRFAAAGLTVTGLDPDPDALAYAARQGDRIAYVQGDVRALPFADGAFDYCSAVTSLCFVDEPRRAVAELWRVARRGVVLGLLHRTSALYWRKAGRGGYRGARWDRLEEVAAWWADLTPAPTLTHAWGIFLPTGGPVARTVERLAPASLPLGGFMVVAAAKPSSEMLDNPQGDR